MCQQCHERPALYHVTRVVDGNTEQDLHLCEVCAAQHGEAMLKGPVLDPSFSIQQFLAGLLAGITDQTEAQAAQETANSRRCPRCGCGYHEFTKTGLLGCPECYDAFSEQLEPLVRRIHGKTRHEGKVPRRGGGALMRRRRVEELRKALAGAVAAEQFEQAAVLRDQIRALERAQKPES